MASIPRTVPRYSWINPAVAVSVASLVLAALVAGLLYHPLGVFLACIGFVGYLTAALSVKHPWRGLVIAHATMLLVGVLAVGAWAIYLIIALPIGWPPFGVGWVGGRAFARWILTPPRRRFA